MLILFTNIPLEETNDICIGTFFGNTKGVEGLSKIKFKELLSLATKESHFTFNGKFYKQVDGVTIGSLLDLTLTNAFPRRHVHKTFNLRPVSIRGLVYFEKNWLQNCSSDFKPNYYRR